MNKNKQDVVNVLAKKFVEYGKKNNITNIKQSNINETPLKKDVDNNLMKTFDRPNVTYDWNKETHEIMTHFGKNGQGLTDEFIVIGEFIKRLSEMAHIYITEAYIDGLDDVYDIKINYIYK